MDADETVRVIAKANGKTKLAGRTREESKRRGMRTLRVGRADQRTGFARRLNAVFVVAEAGCGGCDWANARIT